MEGDRDVDVDPALLGTGYIGGGGFGPQFSTVDPNPYGTAAYNNSYPAGASLPAQPTYSAVTPQAPTLTYPGYGGYSAVGGSWAAPNTVYPSAAAALPIANDQVLYGHYASPQAAALATGLPVAPAALPAAQPAAAPAPAPAPAPKAKPADKPKPKTVTVKAGDNLTKLAKAAGVDWKALYEANKDVIGGDPNLIRPGQELKLPA
ncbi:MAG: transglycosylase [Thermoleophilia bacterium]|nr:transglycosylase [Thermoleophilia bacterium]